MTKKVGLVLGGGGARGGVHIGVIKTLVDANVPIDLVVGTSFGALVGGFFAIDGNPEIMEQIYREGFSLKNMFKMMDPTLRHGLLDSKKLEDWIEEQFKGVQFEELKIPFVVVTTDLETGETVYIDKGDVAKAVRAAVSAAPFIMPVEMDNRILTDGWTTVPIPAEKTREMGADVVIASIVDPGGAKEDFELGKLGYDNHVIRSFNIMSHRLILENLKHVDVAIQSQVTDISLGVNVKDFTNKEALDDYMEAGSNATKEKIEEISQKLKG